VEVASGVQKRATRKKRATLNRFQNIDWATLYKVLRVHTAATLRRYRGLDTFDGGQDCEDVVQEVLKDFYRSPNGLGWKQGKGRLETYLGTIVHNKLVDRLRRQKHVSGSLDDPDFSLPAENSHATPAPERAKTHTKDALYSLVKGEAELRDLITAAELVEGGPNVNQELGEVLNKTPRQVSKLKERLLEIDGVKELYAGRQKTKSTRPSA
jgi:DNA-directed RNA polymerase specialized sigma24 family protein